MGTAQKPAALLTAWATGGTKTAPGAGLISSGWNSGIKPPAQIENWLVDTGAQWDDFLNQLFDDYTPPASGGSDVMFTMGTNHGGFVVTESTPLVHHIRHIGVGSSVPTFYGYNFDAGGDVNIVGSTVAGDITSSGNLIVAGTGNFGDSVTVTATTTTDALVVNTTLNVAGTATFMGAVDALQVDSTSRVRAPNFEVTNSVPAAKANEWLGTSNLIKACGSIKYLGAGAWAQSDGALNVASVARTPAGAPAGDFRILLTVATTPLNNAFSVGSQPNVVILSPKRDVVGVSSPVSGFVLVESYGGSATELFFMCYNPTTGNLADPPADYILNFVVI